MNLYIYGEISGRVGYGWAWVVESVVAVAVVGAMLYGRWCMVWYGDLCVVLLLA